MGSRSTALHLGLRLLHTKRFARVRALHVHLRPTRPGRTHQPL